jgi:uncharacterized protein (DUF2062 family)
MKKKSNQFFLRSLKLLYLKLFRTNDSPQRIAIGLGVGVFLGILPGTGPLAALIAATFLRVNKVSAVLGALLTNTWTSLLTIILSIKVGASIMHLNWHDLYTQWQMLIKNFHWRSLFELSFLEILIPVLTGYLVISATLGLIAYFVSLTILQRRKSASKNKSKKI